MNSLASPDHSDVDAWLLEIKRRVDARLERFFEQKRDYARTLSEPSRELVDALHGFTQRGGKRTRPAVLVAGHLAVSADTSLEALLDPCAGLELLQSYLLVHDDWMDQDDDRRGGPALHKLFSDRCGDRHLGASLAVLAGDLASAFAVELTAGAPMPEAHRTAALRVFWVMQQDVVLGQALDLIAYRDVGLIQRLKTGSYSVKGPLLLGAVIGGATPAQKLSLERYADPVGQAFQARDDLLGTFGAREKTGKPTGSDLRAGKRTALIEEADERLSGDARGPLDRIFGKPDASAADMQSAIALLERCGARAAVEARMERHRADAAQALHGCGLTAEGVLRLEQLARKFADRDH